MAMKRLFVGNLTPSVTEETVRELLADFGPLGEIRVTDGKGFAFIDIPKEQLAEAIEELNGRDFEGRPLQVDEARPHRERRRAGFGVVRKPGLRW